MMGSQILSHCLGLVSIVWKCQFPFLSTNIPSRRKDTIIAASNPIGVG